jgi:hypothetical protein
MCSCDEGKVRCVCRHVRAVDERVLKSFRLSCKHETRESLDGFSLNLILGGFNKNMLIYSNFG